MFIAEHNFPHWKACTHYATSAQAATVAIDTATEQPAVDDGSDGIIDGMCVDSDFSVMLRKVRRTTTTTTTMTTATTTTTTVTVTATFYWPHDLLRCQLVTVAAILRTSG